MFTVCSLIIRCYLSDASKPYTLEFSSLKCQLYIHWYSSDCTTLWYLWIKAFDGVSWRGPKFFFSKIILTVMWKLKTSVSVKRRYCTEQIPLTSTNIEKVVTKRTLSYKKLTRGAGEISPSDPMSLAPYTHVALHMQRVDFDWCRSTEHSSSTAIPDQTHTHPV